MPTNNLYLGEIVLVSEGDVFYTDIPIDEGIKIILSGGIAAPNMIGEVEGMNDRLRNPCRWSRKENGLKPSQGIA